MRTKVTQVGDPCWTPESVTATVSSVAVLDNARTHYFLATHAPIHSMRDQRTGEQLSEEAVYKHLFKSSRKEVLAAIIGAPGTGKSHLVNWLKLRCDEDIASGELKNVLPVLVRRGTGTLKDALRQLIDQLPRGTRKYLKELEGAIVNVSAATSREKLLNEIQLELGPRGKDRGLELPRSLKQLHHVCLSPGFRKWLLRAGGTVSQTVSQLSESHDIVELGSALPQFTAQDFLVPKNLYSDNSPAVLQLIDEFEEEPENCAVAAKTFNAVLPNAIREMTGLSGTKLRDILDNIRADLKKDDQILALLIEDVSVMEVLDAEVLNALEPQGGCSDICGLIAVLGMVESQYKQLRDNQEQRISDVVSLGAATVVWREDPHEMAQFTARYLNAMRLSETEVKRVAEERKTAGDVTISACTKCHFKDSCHASFGKVSFGEIDVGLFPFTSSAPQALLNAHVEPKKHTPRGFLIDILEPLTRNSEVWENHAFPPAHLQVRFSLPSYWTAFETKYCAGWDEDDKLRLRRLIDKWTASTNADEAFSNVQLLLEPLRFPALSKVSKPLAQSRPTAKQKTTTPPPPPPASSKYAELQNALSAWVSGGTLQRDQEFRQVVADLVRNGVAWDEASAPIAEVERHLGSGGEYEFVSIEGMKSRVNKKFLISLPRGPETARLLDALLKYQYDGGRSWTFPDSEIYKRVIHDWLRGHQAEITASINPRNLSPNSPLLSALQVLTFAAIIRDRMQIDGDPASALGRILSDSEQPYPVPLSEGLKRHVEQLPIAVARCREFILKELDVPQGAGATVFINPTTLLSAMRAIGSAVAVTPVSKEYFEDFWETRYSSLKLINSFAGLATAIAEEKRALSELSSAVKTEISALGYVPEDITNALDQLKSNLSELIKAALEGAVCHAGNTLDEEIRARLNGDTSEWSRQLALVDEIGRAGSDSAVVACEPRDVVDLAHILGRISEFIDNIAAETQKQIEHYGKIGDTKAHLDTIKSALAILASGGTE